nr:MAG TPA: hypothetical protein [Caudoviricetes sp.]
MTKEIKCNIIVLSLRESSSSFFDNKNIFMYVFWRNVK